MSLTLSGAVIHALAPSIRHDLTTVLETTPHRDHLVEWLADAREKGSYADRANSWRFIHAASAWARVDVLVSTADLFELDALFELTLIGFMASNQAHPTRRTMVETDVDAVVGTVTRALMWLDGTRTALEPVA